MSFLSLRCGSLAALVFALFFTASPRLAADLAWSPETGWRIEGGALSGLLGDDGRKALDLMNTARSAEENGNRRTALKNYGRVSKRYPSSIYAPEALYRAGHMRLSRRQYYKAFDAFQALVSRYPNTPRFNSVVGEQYRIASALLDGARNYTLGMFPGFTNREKAIEYFEMILGNAPYSDYAPLALMNIARGHQRLKNEIEAIDALDRMINFYPQSVMAPDAYLKLAQTHASLVEGAYYDQASTNEAITFYEDFIILFPGDTHVASAEKGLGDMKQVLAESKMKIADFYFYKRNNYTAARVFYNEAITVYPDSLVAQKAREQLTKVEEAASRSGEPGERRKRFFLF